MSNKENLLSKIGRVLAAGMQIVGMVFPILRPFLGSGTVATRTETVVNDMTAIATVIAQMEVALQGKTGTEKLTAAIPQVINILKTSEMVIGHKVLNEQEWVGIATDYINSTVRLLNNLDGGNVKTA